jgi:RHS repeat-associated protein
MTTGPAVSTYAYDQSDRLTQVATGTTTATYTYDGRGLRATKTVNATTTTAYTWTAAGGLLTAGATNYVYGPADLPIEQIAGSASQWFVQDHLGSTRALLDSSGAIVAGYSYTPWGAVASHTGAASTSLQFAAQYTDAESGFIYLRACYYDPATAQFVTVDPLLDKTHSAYGYVAGNPLNDTDPSGLCGWLCKTAIGIAAGAVIGATVLCVIAEPCGLVEAGAVLAGGGLALSGLALSGGLAIAVAAGMGTAIGVGAAVGAVGSAVWNMNSNSDSGGS